jgi:hypothetical protein
MDRDRRIHPENQNILDFSMKIYGFSLITYSNVFILVPQVPKHPPPHISSNDVGCNHGFLGMNHWSFAVVPTKNENKII